MAMALKDGQRENLPTREEFAAFWQASGSLKPQAAYVLGFTVYGVIIYVIADRFPGNWWPVYVGFAALYLISSLGIWMLIVWKRDARFIRCPQCGDWLGRDASGAYYGPNPKWKTICETGVCCKCGRRLLAEQ
jgi:hypothetical protein